MSLIDFNDWYSNFNEGGAARRAKRDAFIRGTIPPLAPANVHGGSTGHPEAVKNAKKVKVAKDKNKD